MKLGDFGSAVKIKAHTTVPGELQGFVGTQGKRFWFSCTENWVSKRYFIFYKTCGTTDWMQAVFVVQFKAFSSRITA